MGSRVFPTPEMKKAVISNVEVGLSLPEASRPKHSMKDEALLPGILLTLVPLALFTAFFLPTADSGVRCSYRDVAYYYYPLFEQIQSCWESGQLPLWNPYVNLGQPLAGDPTSSVFYPGKVIFFLSSLQICSYALCFKIYLWLHVILAFYSAFRLLRCIGASRIGSTLAGVSYAFSGQVLFQYTNVIYLVGSAWAPLHFAYALVFFKERTARRKITALCKLSAILAITILGGEPQIVYLTLLTSTVVSLFWARPIQEAHIVKPERFKGRITASLCFLLGTCVLTGLLASIQILPSLEAVERSTRSDDNGVRSIWEFPSAFNAARAAGMERPTLHKEICQGLLCQDFSQNGRSRSIYRFSVGPWRWLEYLFPNAGGKQFPQSARWFEAFPEELSVWTPTLYFGIIPFLLALASMRLRRGASGPASDQPRAFISAAATWLVLFGLLGALGGFGLVWLIRFLKDVVNGTTPNMTFVDGDPVGGLYWLLNLVLPKFVEFRYPAKLLTVAAIGFSTLAGIGWDYERSARKFKVLMWTAFTLAITGVVVLLIWGRFFFSSLQIPTNPLFGPFQPQLSCKIVLCSLVQTAIVLGVTLAAPDILRRLTGKRERVWLSGLVLLIVAGDLFFANRWLITVAPSRLFERSSEIVSDEFKNDLAGAIRSNPPTRVYRYPIWFPAVFQTKSSPRRVTERVVWDVETLYPMYPFARGAAIVDVRGAVMEKEYAKFIDEAFTGVNLDADLAFLDVRYILGPRFWTERISPSGTNSNQVVNSDWSVFFKKLETPPSRARLFRNGQPVETSPQDDVTILSYRNNEIIFLLKSSDSAELVVSEQYWPDWSLELLPVSNEVCEKLKNIKQHCVLSDELQRVRGAEVSNQRVEPVFGFLRKASIPPGRYCAVMRYRPRKLYAGAAISGAGWTALLMLAAIHLRRRRNKSSRLQKTSGAKLSRPFS